MDAKIFPEFLLYILFVDEPMNHLENNKVIEG